MGAKRILVTGGSGKLGQLLVDRLVDQGHKLRLLTRKMEAAFEYTAIELFQGDLTDKESLKGIAKDIDVVLHLAALTHSNSAEHYNAVNAVGTRNLLESCREEPIGRFIFFGSRADNPQAGEYSLSKFRATHLVAESGLPYLILRPAEIYGIAGEGLAMVEKLLSAYPVIPVISSPAAHVAPVHVDDIVHATITAIVSEQALGRRFTLAGPQEYTLKQLSNLAKSTYGIRKLNIPIPITLLSLVAWLQRNSQSPIIYRDQVPRLLSPKDTDISDAQELLDYSPRSLEDNLDLVFPSLVGR